MRSVGVRELRQRASELLAEIAATGEGIQITNHGRAVARLVPVDPDNRLTFDTLVAAGQAHRGRGDPLAVRPALPPPGHPTTDIILAELRDEFR